jgi:hypothetical protein
LTTATETDESAALATAWRLQRSGNFVAAFDVSQEALRSRPDSAPLQHVSILALASCGSTAAALQAYRATALATSANEDYLALEGRLLKDLALQSPHADNQRGLVEAAQAYERVAQVTGGNFTAQNAALLWMLAGEADRADRLAASVMRNLAATRVPTDPQAAYFHWATLAEAALVRGDQRALGQAVAQADPLCRGNLWARTRTHAQLRRLVPLRADCADIVARWHRPAVALVLADGQRVSSTAASAAMQDAPALAFAAGLRREPDWASLTDRGVQLHVILPDAPADAATDSPVQLTRSRRASGQNAGYTWSSLLLDDGDEPQRTCAQTALGLSLAHADALQAPWVALERTDAGWREYRDVDRKTLAMNLVPDRSATTDAPRYGFLFADAVGYSTLSAAETRRYWTHLLPEAVGAALRNHAGDLLLRKTWGDAVHAVFRTAAAAARAALEMTAATARLADELALGRRLAFRVAVHFGTADCGMDPVEGATSYFGPQLSFAARIVPVAPPGSVFATEAFAAQLSLEGAADLVCDYVGTTSLAKDYGRVRLLALSSRR